MDDWNKNRANEIVERALNASRADATIVRVRHVREGATRYANSEITQNVVHGDAALEVEAAFGAQVGRTATNRLDHDSLAACVERAEAIARVTPPDPEYMPPVEPSACPEVAISHPATAAFSPTDRAEAIRQSVALAEREGMTGAGVFSTHVLSTTVANSAGLFVHNEESDAFITFSATSSDNVGWAQGRVRDLRALDLAAIARRAIEKARAGRSPRDLSPGRYDVVLEPAALSELLAFFFVYQMDAKATDEGRTFLSGKRGFRIAASNINIFSDPTAAVCPSRPFTDEGMTLHRVDWLRNGVLKDLVTSRFWAKKHNLTPTGIPTNVVMEGGETSDEEMIRTTDRGLLVTRFWYVRAVEPMRDLYTGMTRDGTFLIEGGEIVGPVKNFRFNESAVHLLENIDLLGRQEIAGPWPWAAIPSVKARDFNFTSSTRF